jgi:hypothetical protein
MQIKERRGRTSELSKEEMEQKMLINFRHYGADYLHLSFDG